MDKNFVEVHLKSIIYAVIFVILSVGSLFLFGDFISKNYLFFNMLELLFFLIIWFIYRDELEGY